MAEKNLQSESLLPAKEVTNAHSHLLAEKMLMNLTPKPSSSI